MVADMKTMISSINSVNITMTIMIMTTMNISKKNAAVNVVLATEENRRKHMMD